MLPLRYHIRVEEINIGPDWHSPLENTIAESQHHIQGSNYIG